MDFTDIIDIPDTISLEYLLKGYMDQVVKFAQESGKIDNLQAQLNRLGQMTRRDAKDPQRILLMGDFSPYSFLWRWQVKREDQWLDYMVGGLIFHGKHDRGGDGGAPTFSVCVEPTDGWAIHT